MQEPGRSGYRLEVPSCARVPGTGEAKEDDGAGPSLPSTATSRCSDQDKGRLGSSQHSSLHGNVHTFIMVCFRIGDAKVLYKQMTNK